MMNTKSYGLRIELITSEEAFIAIKDEWDQLIEKSFNSSFYATYPFVHTVWKHYRSENDQLFILVVRRGSTIVGIAPFRIGRADVGNIRLLKGVQLRVIRFIAEWGSGDKPAILATERPELIWDRIFQFLNKEFTQWDGIWLVEQPVNSPILTRKAVRKIWYSTSVVQNVPSFYTSITGTWEDFLKSRGKNTQRTWRRDTKKINNLPDGVKFQCFETPEIFPSALKRFIAIEQSGWKRNQSFSVGGNEKNKRFYEELLIILATQNMAAIYLLTSGTTDIAGKLIFKCHTTVYSAHVTYHPDFANYSPGVLLTAEIIKALFGTRFKEFDFLGFGNDGKNDAKRNWSTGERETITIMVNKRNVRMVLFMQGTKLKTMLRNGVSFLKIYKPSEQYEVKKQ